MIILLNLIPNHLIIYLYCQEKIDVSQYHLSRLKGLTLLKLYTWKVRAYGIYARVAGVSEVEQVSAASE